MKRIYTTLFALLMLVNIYGQKTTINHPSIDQADPRLQNVKIEKKSSLNKNKSNSRWISYADAAQEMLGLTFKYAGNNLFPDTNIRIVYSGGALAAPWIHSLADVVDITSMYFKDDINSIGALALSNNSEYKLDSIIMRCFYDRYLNDTTVVDTLKVEILINNPDAYAVSFYTGQTAIGHGTDTLFFMDLPYDYLTNSLDVPNKITYLIPLTHDLATDTLADGTLELKIGLDLPNSTFHLFTATYTFIPGYSYEWNDTLTKKNRLFFISYDEVDNGYMVTYNKRDYNHSYIIDTDVRYNQAGEWNGVYGPACSYSPSYRYDHHLIKYKVTGVSNFGYVGIKESANFLNVNAYPNPANDILNVDLNSNKNAVISIVNLIGQTVKAVNTNSPINTIQISDLAPGMYMLKVEQAGKTFTSKIVVR